MHEASVARRIFLSSWLIVQLSKSVLAAVLPLFVDEAFYWQESQHLAFVYSDLPGCTAWLVRLGVLLGGNNVLAIRAPFLILTAWLPWCLVRMTARYLGPTAGWMAGTVTTLVPLSATLGLLALPDVPLAVATVVCLDAVTKAFARITPAVQWQLAAGLVLGAFAHYRFIAVVGAGCLALVMQAPGRRMLCQPRIWIALLVGLLAWLPILIWNAFHHQAGLRFQFVERHPWHFQPQGFLFVLIQTCLLTPMFAFFCCQSLLTAWRGDRPPLPVQWRYWTLCGALSTAGFFLLGFFADQQRVSFHWPLPGYFAWFAAAPVIIRRATRWQRRIVWGGLAGASLAIFIGYAVIAVPAWRERLSGTRLYPENFSGWDELASAIQPLVRARPQQTIVVDQFKLGAELGFRLRRADIAVLPSFVNARHGRSEQLRAWGLLDTPSRPRPDLLILAPSEMPFRLVLDRYHFICQMLGPLPPPQTVMTPHGDQRFLLFRLAPTPPAGPCTTPVMAWIDTPLANTAVEKTLIVRGWAFKDGVGVSQVRVFIDGRFFGFAQYGAYRAIRSVWPQSTDPNHPYVGFTLQLPVASIPKGRHWLNLRVIASDGSGEDGWFVPWIKQ